MPVGGGEETPRKAMAAAGQGTVCSPRQRAGLPGSAMCDTAADVCVRVCVRVYVCVCVCARVCVCVCV